MSNDKLMIAGKAYSSRLLVGTGKYKDFAETKRAIDASGAEIVTVAIRRTNIGQEPGQPSLLDVLPPATLWLIVLGGVFYSVGVVFFVWQSLRFQSAVWHGFVVTGAAFHMFAVMDCLVINRIG